MFDYDFHLDKFKPVSSSVSRIELEKTLLKFSISLESRDEILFKYLLVSRLAKSLLMLVVIQDLSVFLILLGKNTAIVLRQYVHARHSRTGST